MFGVSVACMLMLKNNIDQARIEYLEAQLSGDEDRIKKAKDHYNNMLDIISKGLNEIFKED